MSTSTRLAALLLAALWSLGAGWQFHIPSECGQIYLPPMPGTPQASAQTIRMVPTDAGTYRLRYGSSPGYLPTYSTGGESGQSLSADTRGEFALTLTPGAATYWRVECSRGGRWRPGWSGYLHALSSSGGTVKLLLGSDAHIPDYLNGSSIAPLTRLGRSISLMTLVRDAHGYVDLGDTFMLHCHTCDTGYSRTDLWGRKLGDYSITDSARSSADEVGFAEVRMSATLRRMWPALHNLPQIWSRGNHRGGSFGGNDPATNARHWQLRTTWVETDIEVDLATDLAAGTGVFTEADHGMQDGDGPYRWASTDPAASITEPTMTGCEGSRPATSDTNEWYVRKLTDDTFKVAYGPALAGCTGASALGTGVGTLLAGSNMQAVDKQMIAKFLAHQNTTYPHTWGTPQDHIMGPVLMSDYILVLNLDEYDYSGLGTCASQPLRLPVSGRDEDCAFSLGPLQQTGAFAEIDEIADGDGLYEDVEILIVTMHGGLGGYGWIGYAYGRGSLCEVDSKCVTSRDDCVVDDDCGEGDTCEDYDCTEPFAHPVMQALQEKMAAMVERSHGIALVLLGHDHQASFGQKGTSGVYYLNAGQLGGPAGGAATFLGEDDAIARYDYDRDGIPAFRRHMSKHGLTPFAVYSPPGEQNGLVERGTEHRGFVTLTMRPAAESDSGKTEILVDYTASAYTDWYVDHGKSPHGFPFLIQGD